MTHRTKRAGTYPIHPIFGILRERGLMQRWLARETGISYAHVRSVAAGIQPAGPKFRAACVEAMQMPESQLFHGAPSERPSEEDGSDLGPYAEGLYRRDEPELIGATA